MRRSSPMKSIVRGGSTTRVSVREMPGRRVAFMHVPPAGRVGEARPLSRKIGEDRHGEAYCRKTYCFTGFRLQQAASPSAGENRGALIWIKAPPRDRGQRGLDLIRYSSTIIRQERRDGGTTMAEAGD